MRVDKFWKGAVNPLWVRSEDDKDCGVDGSSVGPSICSYLPCVSTLEVFAMSTKSDEQAE